MIQPEDDVPDLETRVRRYLQDRTRGARFGASVIAVLAIVRGVPVLGIGLTLGLAAATAIVGPVAIRGGVRIAYAIQQDRAPPGVLLTASATLRAAEMREFLQSEGEDRRPAFLPGRFHLTDTGIRWRPSSWLRRKGLSEVAFDRSVLRSVVARTFPRIFFVGTAVGTGLEARLIDGRKSYFYLTGPRAEEVVRAFAALDIAIEP